MKAKIATAVLAFSALSFAAHAQTVTPQAAPSATPAPAVEPFASKGGKAGAPSEEINKLRQACAGDVQKFCASTEKGKGKMRACLDQHEKDLSASCKEARAARAANPQSKGKG